MAVEKGKVLAAIEAKLKGKSLSKNFKDSLATKWAEKIDTDEDIDSYIDDREDVLLEASSEADRRAVAAAKKAKEEAEKKTVTTTEEEDDELPSGTPDWAKSLVKQNKALASKLEAFEAQQQQGTIQDRFRKDERITALKGIPDHAFSGRIPKSDEEYDSAVESFVNDWKPFLEKHKLGAQGGDNPPSGTGGNNDPKEVKSISKEQATAIAKEMGSY